MLVSRAASFKRSILSRDEYWTRRVRVRLLSWRVQLGTSARYRSLRIPMMSISQSDLMPIRSERSDARLSQCESVIGIRQQFCLV